MAAKQFLMPGQLLLCLSTDFPGKELETVQNEVKYAGYARQPCTFELSPPDLSVETHRLCWAVKVTNEESIVFPVVSSGFYTITHISLVYCTNGRVVYAEKLACPIYLMPCVVPIFRKGYVSITETFSKIGRLL